MTVPQAVAEYMSAQGIPESSLRPDGQLPLVFDGRYRVRVIPLAGGALALESRVGPLPDAGEERERLVERALRLACGRLQSGPESLALTEESRLLCLQSRIGSGATRLDFEALLESHVNALAYWRGALG